jgi:undecaprenyl-diphosphatase
VSWVSVGEAVGLWQRWREEWERVPSPARRAWWVGLGQGVLVVQAATLLLLAAARHLVDGGRLEREGELLLRLEAANLVSFNDAIWLDVFGNGFFLIPLMLAAAALATHRGAPLASVAILLGYGSLFVPVLTGWLLWPRLRPSLIAEGIGSPGASIGSFPSGHLVQALVAFGLLAYLWARASPSLVERVAVVTGAGALVAAVVVARLRLGAHWPSDMIAAVIIGALWVALVVRALRRAERRAAPS